MCTWAKDTQRFLLEHFDTIHDSPSQIYHSALPFSPSSSWFQRCYSTELSNEVKVVKGLPAEWGACSRTVSLKDEPLSLSYWNNNVAIGLDGDIAILDAITGSQTATFSGHTAWVNCLTFSSDGTLLLSGSGDKTAKLWDRQTGGVVKTFYGHKDGVSSVSISADYTIAASGTYSGKIHLWDIQTGKCNCVIKQQEWINYLGFSPINPQQLISISSKRVLEWDIHGHQVGSAYGGSSIAFSMDGTQLALCNGGTLIVQTSESREVLATFDTPNGSLNHCCFSPDGKFVAAAVGSTAYVWNIAASDHNPVELFHGHATRYFAGLVFSSTFSLLSVFLGESVKFWEINPSLADSVPLPSAAVTSISLKQQNGIAISCDSDGVVKTWDIVTGSCKASFQTPAKGKSLTDVQLVDGKVILVWNENGKVHIWDAEKGEIVQEVTISPLRCNRLRISGDGSKVFCLHDDKIEAWSMKTGEFISEAEFGGNFQVYFYLENSKIWVQLNTSGFDEVQRLEIKGWDFGISGSSPLQLHHTFPERPHLEFFNNPLRIKDNATGKDVFQLPRNLDGELQHVQWNGQYLVAVYTSGEVLILDFCHMFPQQQSVVQSYSC